MLLKNDAESKLAVIDAVKNYYKTDYSGDMVRHFKSSEVEGWNGFDEFFLIKKKYVIKYGIVENDRSPGRFLGGLSLAIGPYFFSPSEFWSYKDSERFEMSATTEAVIQNLKLLEEFLASQENISIPSNDSLRKTSSSKNWFSRVFS